MYNNGIKKMKEQIKKEMIIIISIVSRYKLAVILWRCEFGSPKAVLHFEVLSSCLDFKQTPDKDLTWGRTGSEICFSTVLLIIRLLTLRQLVYLWTSKGITSIKKSKKEFLTWRVWKIQHWDITMSGEYILIVMQNLVYLKCNIFQSS